MILRLLEPREIDQVLGQNYSVWSPGLSPARYRHYQWWQLGHPWGSRNLEYYGYFDESGTLVASCKRYNFQYQSRGKICKIAGIGAVFVPDKFRGKSYGLRMLEEMAALSAAEDYDALLLNSDIDPAYYARIGFKEFQAINFSVLLDPAWLQSSIKQMDRISDKNLDESFAVKPPEDQDIAEMCRHHKRWLAAQPYGLCRSVAYWRYKIGREHYLYQHSSLNWPKLSIITDNYGKFAGGYALLEQSGPYMRVLEVIGPERIFNSLWGQILRLAQRRKASTLRGWQKMAPPLRGLNFGKRNWSLPMILPLKSELAAEILEWTGIQPPCLLELDHF